ncbi:MAG: FtsQ-type POTRA domain-containing protein [Patescibacteria group bacterium]
MTTYRGSHKLKHRKRRKRFSIFRHKGIFILVFLIVLISGALYYFTSKQFQVDDVLFTGLSQTPEADVREYLDVQLLQKKFFVLPANVIWLVSPDALAIALTRTFPTLKSVRIVRKYPRSLEVRAVEFAGWGVLCHGEPEECFWIDRGGVAFDHAPGFSGIIVPKIRDKREREFKLGERQLSDKMMQLIAYFDERAVSNDYLQSLQFTIDARDQTLRVTARGGWDILLLEGSDPESAYKNLKTSLEGEIKDKVANLLYIDLRFGNRIFYKFKGETN